MYTSFVTYDELHTVDPEDLEDWLLRVEKSFNLTFDQHELADVKTFGQLTDHIMNKFTLSPSDDCTTQQAFYKLRLAIMSVCQVDAITPHTLLTDVLPRKNRIQTTKLLERELGINLQLLEPPAFVMAGLFAFLVASLFGFWVNFQIGITGLLILIVGTWLAATFGKELRVETVGELAGILARENYVLSRRNASTFNRKEIEKLLATWLCEDFSLSKAKLTRESTFEWAETVQK